MLGWGKQFCQWIFLFTIFITQFSEVFAESTTFELTLPEAENQALSTSNRLRSTVSDYLATVSQKDAEFEKLIPRLNFQANYQYYGNIPNITLGLSGSSPIPFGTHSTFFIGPTLNYTLWDAFSDRKSYQSYSILSQAKEEDQRNAKIQLLLTVRSTYLQVRLGLEELRLIFDSLNLAKAQERDILARYRAGAATRLDRVTAQRSVLNYEIQFKQRQAELSASFEDLLALISDGHSRDVSRPGPPGIPNLSVLIKLDRLDELIEKQGQTLPSPPDDEQPQIKSQLLQAEALMKSSESLVAKRYGSLQLSAGVSLNRPNIPNPPTYWQETVGAFYTLPLYFGDPSRHIAAQQRNLADSSYFRANQTRIDLRRDFEKALDLLNNLKERKSLAVQDVTQSEEAAKLYYTSYQAGRINFIDVLNANVQAFQAKVNATRIDAQILNQLNVLKALSGKENPREFTSS